MLHRTSAARLEQVASALSVVALLAILLVPFQARAREPDPGREARFLVELACLAAVGISTWLGAMAFRRSPRSKAGGHLRVVIVVGLALNAALASGLGLLMQDYYRVCRADYIRHVRFNHAMRLAEAIHIYCDDNGGRLPPSDGWRAAVKPYVRERERLYPGRRSALRDLIYRNEKEQPFGMNGRLGGIPLRDVTKPDKTIMIFESSPARSVANGPKSVPLSPVGNQRRVVFVDLRPSCVSSRSELEGLKWSVK